jgi:putative acetyltransferase
MMADVTIMPESPLSADAQRLLTALTVELSDRYDDDGGANSFSPADVQVPRSAFLIARKEGVAVACGALRPLKAEIAEIKRMYVAPEARGLGISRKLLGELETLARGFGYAWLWLETGSKQPEAMSLYSSCGFQRRESYGYYADHPLSICFEKQL